MELEEAIKSLKEFAYTNYGAFSQKEAKLILQALDNSIPKEKVKKIEKYCKTKSKFQTFGDEQLKRAIEVYVNKTKNDVLSLLEE